MVADDVSEQSLLTEGLARLRSLLGSDYEVGPYNVVGASEGVAHAGTDMGVDALIAVKDQSTGTYSPVLVEVKRRLTPADADRDLVRRLNLMRRLMGQASALVISPWLSPRTRDVLDAVGCGYLDFTGNVSFRLNRPAVLLRTAGADRDPSPSGRRDRGLRGARAGRLVRLLVDVAPPYRTSELAERAAISLGYTSRLLDAMEQQALITRRGRVISDVNWDDLLRERADQSPPLLRAGSYLAMVASQGIRWSLRRLSQEPDLNAQVAVTGSLAAIALAPVAAGGQLMLYVSPGIDPVTDLGPALRLLPAREGADVLLLRPDDDVVFARTRVVDETHHVALSQLVLDCLGGTGRMPAEGEAVLDYMQRTVEEWRLTNLAELTPQAA